MIHLTYHSAKELHDILKAAEEYIRTARLNDDQDDEGDLRHLEIELGANRLFLAALLQE